MNLGLEVLELMRKAKLEGEYQNPHLLLAFLEGLDTIGIEHEDLDEWASDMWSR